MSSGWYSPTACARDGRDTASRACTRWKLMLMCRWLWARPWPAPSGCFTDQGSKGPMEQTCTYICLLCEDKERPFKHTALSAVKMHLQKHLGCTAQEREEMVKRSKGRVISELQLCGRGRTPSIGQNVSVFSLPDPDGREWLRREVSYK